MILTSKLKYAAVLILTVLLTAGMALASNVISEIFLIDPIPSSDSQSNKGTSSTCKRTVSLMEYDNLTICQSRVAISGKGQ